MTTLADTERALRATISKITGCSTLDVQAVPGRNARVEITLTGDQAAALAAHLAQPTDTTQPPQLDIDRKLYANRKMGSNAKLERRIVWRLCAHLAAGGWQPEMVLWDEHTPVTDAKSAMEMIFNLDDCWVRFHGPRDMQHSVRLVLGNGGDIISDWTYADNDATGFNALMDSFDSEACA
jgi:hypothetical protein